MLKLTCPGVPDIYQGNEIWTFSLVDPDNRQPVDFEKRNRMLKALTRKMSGPKANLEHLASSLVKSKEDGRIKLYVSHRTLVYRRDHRDLFANGAYASMEVAGGKKDHACALARTDGKRSILVVVPRLVCTLVGGAMADPLGFSVWEGTWVTVPPEVGRSFHNVLTGERIETVKQGDSRVLMLGEIFSVFPVALLEAVG